MDTLSRPIGDLITGRIVDTLPTTTLRDAAVLLDEEAVGALLVDDPRGVLGIVTERDLIRAMADGVDIDDTRVDEYLTDHLLTVESSDTMFDVLQAMRGNAVRHIVVRDDEGRVTGVVSMRGLVDELLGAVVTAPAPAA